MSHSKPKPVDIEEFFNQNPDKILDNCVIGYTENYGTKPYEIVIDGKIFIDACLQTLKEHTGDKRWMPCYNRLLNYYLICRNGTI